MTRKETIKWLESLKAEIGKPEHRVLWHYAESIDVVIKALKADIVRCKDCIHRQTYMCPMYREEWHTIEAGDGYFVDDDLVVFDCTVDDGYCYLGERKNNAVEESEAEE